MSLYDMPKVELHLHLEGAAPPEFIRRLAQEKHVDVSGVFDDEGNYAYDGFVDFLRVYEGATEVLKTPEDYHRLTLAVLEQSAANGVIYTEAFLSPDFCGGRDVGAWREYLHAMQEAADIAQARHGIIMRGIVTPIRHFGPDKAKETALCAAETAGDWIVGLGIGGDENMGQPADFAYAFDMAREAGLRLTAHAGEFGGPESVRDAVNDLKVERIGHGVRAIEDAGLVEELAARGIVLEVCPGSNIALGLYPDWASHPIARLRDAGVKVTISTDDPPFFHTTMNNEYNNLAQAFAWDKDVFKEINITAANAAFCNAGTRNAVLTKLE
ncbi:MAG: adenosine deaminase [Marinosulfonomonas sp.]|nr:adenosine deaminase [Marinosulfonomonas sp.]